MIVNPTILRNSPPRPEPVTGIIEAVVAEEDEDDFNLENFFPGPPAPPPSMPGINTSIFYH